MHVSCLLHCKIDHSLIFIVCLFSLGDAWYKGGSQKTSSSSLDLCNNGDYNIPSTGLEFHNTQLLPNSPSQRSAAVDAPIPPQSSCEQELAR